jgi:hypothetical protein
VASLPLFPPWQCGPKHGIRHEKFPGVSFFGEWLPQGRGPDQSAWPEKIARCPAKFDRYGKLSKEYFNVPDEEIVEDEAQTAYVWKQCGSQLPSRPSSHLGSARELQQAFLKDPFTTQYAVGIILSSGHVADLMSYLMNGKEVQFEQVARWSRQEGVS